MSWGCRGPTIEELLIDSDTFRDHSCLPFQSMAQTVPAPVILAQDPFWLKHFWLKLCCVCCLSVSRSKQLLTKLFLTGLETWSIDGPSIVICPYFEMNLNTVFLWDYIYLIQDLKAVFATRHQISIKNNAEY